jgi:ribosomal protein L11 methyltransferase
VTWSAVRVVPGHSEGRDAIVAALFARGAQAVVEDGAAFLTHFSAATDLAGVRAAVYAADPGATITDTPLADENWSVTWRSRLSAHEVGGLTVAPPWLAASLDPERSVVIEPAMAFGTGDHATTRGVIRMLSRALQHGDVVADLGAGSAVLAIAAAKLGARRVYAIERDPDAIGNASDNVHANGVAQRVHVLEGDAFALLPLVAPVNLVLANIVSSVLSALLPVIEASLTADGHAILSGLLLSERSAFSALLSARQWQILDECEEDEWWTVTIAKI